MNSTEKVINGKKYGLISFIQFTPYCSELQQLSQFNLA